jgi:glutamate 5-kinase
MNPSFAVREEELEAARTRVRGAQTVVVKVGSNVLVGSGGSAIARPTFCALVESLANLARVAGRRLILVSSGAVALGRSAVGDKRVEGRPEVLAHKQALAALGQGTLMHLYKEEFGFYGWNVAQVLVTRGDFSHRERFLNVRNTLRELGEFPNVIPIVNENDTVANDELRFGDNDNLAAQVSNAVSADVLVILSDVSAIYTADPAFDADARPIPVVYGDDPSLTEIAGPSIGRGFGSGGMRSKVRAAKMACSFGVPTVIAAGREQGVLGRILSVADVGTLVVPRSGGLGARKAWIGFGSVPEGVVVVDDGAVAALAKGGRSLLPAGVVDIDGEFGCGAPVNVSSTVGKIVARGLVAYSHVDLVAIAGRESSEIEETLGYSNGAAVIHADDLVLVDP